MLHEDCGIHKTFSAYKIREKVINLGVSSTNYRTINNNIYSYCVANHDAGGYKDRYLYREGEICQRRYRLYRGDYPYDPGREKGRVEPDLPQEYERYIAWYHDEYCRDAYAEWEPPGTVDVAKMNDDPPPAATEAVTRFVRDVDEVQWLKDKYKDECQVCGRSIQITPDRRYSEVHHLRPLAEDGSDGFENMLVLCPTHHVEFDYAAIGVSCDGSGVIDRTGKALCNLVFVPSHRLSRENIRFQLGRMGLL